MRHHRHLSLRLLSRLAFSAACVLGLAPAACSRAQPWAPAAEHVTAKPGVSATAAPRAAELDTHTRGWQLGESYTYELTLTTKVAFASGPASFDFDLRGHASVTPVSVTPELATLYVQVADAAIVSRIPGSQPELDKVAAEIRTHGVFFSLLGGLLSELRVPNGQTVMATSSYREIASALQFAHARTNAETYVAEEYDPSGRYVAEYRRLGDGRFRKQKQKYLEILGAKSAVGMRSAPIIPQVTSTGDVRVSPRGRPVRVELDEKLAFNGQIPIRSSLSLLLSESAGSPAPNKDHDWDALLAGTAPLAASAPLGSPPPVESLDTARIGKLTFPEVLSELEQLARKDAAAQGTQKDTPAGPPIESDADHAEREARLREDSRLFAALSALFRQKPALATQALTAIHQKSPATPFLLDALSSASTSEAQAALVQLMQDKKLDAKQRKRATMALLRTPKPSSAAVSALKALLELDPFDAYGLYGLGTYSRHLRDAGKTDEAAELGEFVSARLKLAKDATDLGTVLRGIANSGYAGALDRVRPYLRDRRSDVRAAAVRALQSMHAPEVDALLAQSLASDASPDVREAAIASAQVREPTDAVIDALASAGKQASDAHVRFRAVELMIRWLPSRPVLREALQTIARNDAESRVRERASSAL